MEPTPAAHDVVRPQVVLLDVNETLSDLAPMGEAFADVGLDAGDAPAWFAGVLRDAFALTVLGDNPSFADVGAATLRVRLAAAGVPDPAGGAEQVMGRFASLEPHPDVVPGLRGLADAGCRIATLSNGSSAVARALLDGTGADEVVEAYLDVADAGAWKPDARAYRSALATLSVDAGRAMLVAVHPWDIEGARRAGLRTAWINRTGADYPDHLGRADVEAASFVELAEMLGASPR